MACDICRANDKELSSLRDCYQTKDVKQVCPDCLKEINRQLSNVRSVTHNLLVSLMKRFTKELRGEPDKAEEELRRQDAIATISWLYPPDSQFEETAKVGRELLNEARLDPSKWRDEDTEVLVRFSQLCRERHGD